MINALLSRIFYIQLNFQNPFTRLRNWLFTCKISSNNIRHVIFSMRHDLRCGLVVRIRRSHRRGPGSIPGVGIVSLFGESLFICWGVWPVTKALWKSLLPDITEDEKMCISLFSWIRHWLSYMTFSLKKSQSFEITSVSKNTWMILNTIAFT